MTTMDSSVRRLHLGRAAPVEGAPARPALAGCFRAATLVAGLLVVATAGGLFFDTYARETDFARNAYQGADVVTLALALPLLLVSMALARRGSTRGTLLWLGAMAYVTYQYGYTFAYAWNRLFLVYLALLSVSAFTVARALILTDPADVAGRFDTATPHRAVGGFLWFVGGALALMELAMIIPTIFTGDVPQIVIDTGHVTSPVFILDLGLVVPLMLLGGSWIRAGAAWGYVAAPVLLVKGTAEGLALLAGNLFAVVNDGKTDGPLNVLWAAIALGCATMLWLLLRHVRDVPG